MSTPARTPAAGLPHPAWPVRPTVSPRRDVPERPVVAERIAPERIAPERIAPERVVAGRPVQPVAPSLPAPVAAQEAPDPRTIARESLAAGRNRSLWWTLGGVAASIGVAFVTDAVVGSAALAVLVLVFAVVRLVGPADGPAAVSVRSKALDVAVLTVCGVALLVLASVLPSA